MEQAEKDAVEETNRIEKHKKIQKEAERHMKAADKALEKKSKMDEIKTKEEDETE